MNEEQAATWISSHRLEPYLSEAEGDFEHAVALYEWNARLTAACFEVVHHVEVLVRTAVDRVLGVGQPSSPVKDTWLLDFDVLDPPGIRQVLTAIDRLPGKGPASRELVVGSLSFGFWRGLFDKRYEGLWRSRLHKAFPSGTGQRNEVAALFSPLHPFRNRLAHHHSLLRHDVELLHCQLLDLAATVDQSAQGWITARSEVLSVLAQRPEWQKT